MPTADQVAITFVDGPYGMGKYAGDEIRTTDSQILYKAVFQKALLNNSKHLFICGMFDSLSWIHDNEFVPAEYKFRTNIIWHKPDWVGGASSNFKTFPPKHEMLLHYSLAQSDFYMDAVRIPYGDRAKQGVQKKAGRTKGWIPNPKGARRPNVWSIAGERLQGHKTRKAKHYCEKPKELLRVIVLSASSKKQVIDEPFYGSDNLKQVCVELNRRHKTYTDAWDYIVD